MSPGGGARRLTPAGAGAVAVIEVAGADAAARLARIGLTSLPGPGEIRLVRPRAEGGLLDEALLLRTGAERLELHVHASPPLVAELCERLGVDRSAAPRGVEERALELAPQAASELGARVLLAQADGALRREVEALVAAPPGRELPLLARAAPLARLLVPARVVLVGAVNAGKSTLFNALAGEARATVSDEAGTTRDVLVARAFFGPYPVELHDTAGARELAPGGGLAVEVEREGQALARGLVERADLVLDLAPAGGPAGKPTGEPAPPPSGGSAPRLALRTKADRLLGGGTGAARGEVAISVLRDSADAVASVAGAALDALGLPRDPFPDPAVGAPFTAELAACLRAAFERPPGPAREAALAACLGPRRRSPDLAR